MAVGSGLGDTEPDGDGVGDTEGDELGDELTLPEDPGDGPVAPGVPSSPLPVTAPHTQAAASKAATATTSARARRTQYTRAGRGPTGRNTLTRTP